MIGREEKIQKINGNLHRFFFEPHFNSGVAGKSLDGKPVGFIEFAKSSAEVRGLFDAPEVSQIEKKNSFVRGESRRNSFIYEPSAQYLC
ncbi:hypothetical protein [uncultured Methanocorpusculum sp.]|nr:hypothetical protein [uncultured Methanocorpusculum sp.]